MQATRLTAILPESRELRLQLPDHIAPGTIEVLILSVEPERTPPNQGAVLNAVSRLPRREPGITREVLDERLSAERDAWE